MKYSGSSRYLSVSLGLSILLHLCLLGYFYSLPSTMKLERAPMFVDFLSAPAKKQREERSAVTVKEVTERDKIIKAEKQEIPAAGEISPQPEVPSLPALTESPLIELPQETGTASGADSLIESPSSETLHEPGTSAAPLPSGIPKLPFFPTIKDLTPSLEQLAKIDRERGGEGKEEETVSLDSTDLKYTSYLQGVKFKIEGVWKYPEEAKKRNFQGKGLVSFSILRDGTLSELKILSSTGYPALDEGILNAIKSAAPFNPMTENMPVKILNIVATFEYNLILQRIW